MFDTALELLEILRKEGKDADMLIMSAAVGDFIVDRKEGKLDRRKGALVLSLKPSPDVVATVKREFPHVYVVGFSAEFGTTVERAMKKMKDKGIDAIVYNDVSRREVGFGSDFNEVYVIFSDGRRVHIPYGTKREVSRSIWQEVIEHASNG